LAEIRNRIFARNLLRSVSTCAFRGNWSWSALSKISFDFLGSASLQKSCYFFIEQRSDKLFAEYRI
jgi:hypothetical protein